VDPFSILYGEPAGSVSQEYRHISRTQSNLAFPPHTSYGYTDMLDINIAYFAILSDSRLIVVGKLACVRFETIETIDARLISFLVAIVADEFGDFVFKDTSFFSSSSYRTMFCILSSVPYPTFAMFWRPTGGLGMFFQFVRFL